MMGFIMVMLGMQLGMMFIIGVILVDIKFMIEIVSVMMKLDVIQLILQLQFTLHYRYFINLKVHAQSMLNFIIIVIIMYINYVIVVILIMFMNVIFILHFQ